MGKPPDVKGYTPKEVYQKIKSEDQWEVDLNLDPKKIPWIYIGNIIQRTLSRMIGQGPYGPVTVKCTKEGNLATVARGGAFDDYERLEFAFTSANEEVEFAFSQQVERIDIFTYDGKCDYQLTRDLIKDYGHKIELFSDSFYSLDFYTRRVKCTCKSFAPKSSGNIDGASSPYLVDSAADFVTDDVKIGDVVANITDKSYATVITAPVSAGDNLELSENIFPVDDGDAYSIEGTRVKLMGWFREAG